MIRAATGLLAVLLGMQESGIVKPEFAPRAAMVGGPAFTPGDHTFELTFGGLRRRYIVHVPAGADQPLPVMLALHGGGGSAAQFKADNGLDPVADAHHFLAVYPDGTGPLRTTLLTWDAGTNCCGWALEHKVDDVGFLTAVIEDLARRTPIDRHRIYVTGHSNGAIMAYRFAAERADLVAAIVPVSGAMAMANFHPSRPVAILDLHSVDDPRAPYDGGIGPPFPGTNSRVLHAPVKDGLEAWANNNGCRLSPDSVSTQVGQGVNAGQTATRFVYRGCRPGGDIVHIRFTGVGHGWPGAPQRPMMRGILGRSTSLVDASEAAWDFASRYMR